ncbi:unnamed protein product [Anisakis simplex]|uniref:Gustatory receptor n=1 Tax=Anisakis simplex TaxID=6269 RepID=A0A0M3K0Q0_ANISI|nr:unnamed protein product [Anisakis simplex]
MMSVVSKGLGALDPRRPVDETSAMQLPTETSSRNVGDSVTIYGPLVYVLKFCTLRLGERIVDHTANARVSKGDKLKDWIRLTFVSIIGLLILYRSVILVINQRAAMHADLLSNYMSRHIDILNVCGHFNQRIASLVSTWIVISAIGVLCNLANFYLLLSATWPYLSLCIVLIAFWCSHFGTILYNCFRLYAQVQRTRHLVLNVKDIWQNVNEKLCLLIFGTVKRIEEFQHLQLLLIAPIEPSFFMKVTVIVLLSVVYLLATQFRLPHLRMDDGTIETTNLFNLTQP